MVEVHSFDHLNENKEPEESFEGCLHINTRKVGILTGDGIREGDNREVTFVEEVSKID